MRTITIYGASDDLIEIEGSTLPEPDEFSPAPKNPGVVKIEDPDGGRLLVFVQYAANNLSPCWMIGLSQVDDEDLLPHWPIRWSITERGYSMKLEIDLPDGSVITKELPRIIKDNQDA